MTEKYPGSEFPSKLPPQKQDKQPGMSNLMNPKPIYECEDYVSVKKLQGKVAIITGGDSGIGRAVAIAYAKEGGSIINTTSITAYAGNESLLDYSSTKGAIVSFTRSLALSLAARKIRVNGVAPGPIWTPLIPASFDEVRVSQFGTDVPLGRPGQPVEVAPAYVFLASADASYMTGQVLHVNGGMIING